MRAKQKVNKQQVLKEILTGKRSFTSLLPPRSFIVTVKNNLYNVSGPNIEPLSLDPDQYALFKAGLREIDIVFELMFCDFSGKNEDEPQKQLTAPQKQLPSPAKQIRYRNQAGNEPLASEDELEAQFRASSKLLAQSTSEPTKGRKKQLKSIKRVIEQPVIIEMKQSGLMSEYGTTWKASFGK